MNTQSNDDQRIFAIVAYLIPILGGIIALAIGQNAFTKQHASNTIAMPIVIVLSFFAWALIGYVIALIPLPYVGPIIAVALFAQVMIVIFYCLILWLLGLWSAIRGKSASQSLPLVSRISKVIFSSE